MTMTEIEALPQPSLLQWQSAGEFGIDRLADYYAGCSYDVCEYSLGIKLMWRKAYNYRFCEVGGCLLCREEAEGISYFDYPVPLPGGDVEAALSALENDCMETDTPLRFTTAPVQALGLLSARYDGVEITKMSIWRDYLYSAREIESLAGKKFSGQRNHLRHFEKACPGAVFREMTHADHDALLRFVERFDAAFGKKGENALEEREAAFAILLSRYADRFRIGCMEYRGEIIGVCLSEKCGDTLVIHIEKALAKEHPGVYPALFHENVKHFGGDCARINREDDAGDHGLRTSKLQYQPIGFGEKYEVVVRSLLHRLYDLPMVATERLTLSGLTERDIPAYAALCRDDERNRYWGYDYRADLSERAADREFYEMTVADNAAHRSLALAVRLEGELIGEAILYRPDLKGTLELGVRILPAFAGQGYGGEAFAAMAELALYTLDARGVRARCFKENIASRKMLENGGMRKLWEDEKMLYFLRTV